MKQEKKLWIVFALVMSISFAVLGYYGYEIYQQAPPVPKEIVTDSAVRRLLFDTGDDLDDLMTLCEADITSKNEFKVQKYLRNFRVVREKIKDVEARDSIRNWKNPVTGELIMSTFNIGPCKLIGEIKEAVKDAIFDGIIPNDSVSAIQYMEQKGFELGLTITKFN